MRTRRLLSKVHPGRNTANEARRPGAVSSWPWRACGQWEGPAVQRPWWPGAAWRGAGRGGHRGLPAPMSLLGSAPGLLPACGSPRCRFSPCSCSAAAVSLSTARLRFVCLSLHRTCVCALYVRVANFFPWLPRTNFHPLAGGRGDTTWAKNVLECSDSWQRGEGTWGRRRLRPARRELRSRLRLHGKRLTRFEALLCFSVKWG